MSKVDKKIDKKVDQATYLKEASKIILRILTSSEPLAVKTVWRRRNEQRKLQGLKPVSKQAVSQCIQRLLKKGFVIEAAPRLYAATEKGALIAKEYAEEIYPLTNRSASSADIDKFPVPIRSENIAILLTPRKKNKQWEHHVKTILNRKGIPYTISPMGGWSGYNHRYENVTVQSTSDSLMVHLPKRKGMSVMENLAAHHEILVDIVPSLERLYCTKFQDEIQLVCQEHAAMLYAAEHYPHKEDFGKYWVFYDPQTVGGRRWKLDKSEGIIEWETLTAMLGIRDIHALNLVMKDYGDHPETPLPSDMAVQVEQNSLRATSQEDLNRELVKGMHMLTQQMALLMMRVPQHTQPEKPKQGVKPDYFG